MILSTHNGSRVRLYAGLYMRTKKQTRFWGWGSWGQESKLWGSKVWRSKVLGVRTAEPGTAEVVVAEAERPWGTLAEWLRLAHAQLDRNASEEPGPGKVG